MHAWSLYRHPERAVFVLFTLSGFAGIIYESIWSHYLKLFLGHAAYAQTVVLVMFMGGMAAGAWLAARIGPRITDLLKAYIAIECLIGVCGFVFHDVYLGATEAAYAHVFPDLGGPFLVEGFKTLLAAGLILPQSVLLGMTFPLMTVGVMRRVATAPGETVATLYFVNSLGAALGVLVSGFVLLAWLGLPGTVRFAGAMNLFVATSLLIVLNYLPAPSTVPAPPSPARKVDDAPLLLLLVALLTGTASFIYEIVWIRMLNMVLGSSTHSFELMLSAFIFGLAIGSYWIRRHIARIDHPLAVLGFIQVAMALLALTTLMFYDFSFALMSAALFGLAKTQAGYAAFILVSHGIALLIMLPVTICAGMTLPLVTRALLGLGYGERSVGNAYGSNTVGAIIGVVAAVHFLIPVFGLETALVVGAIIDLGIGIVLLVRFVPAADRRVLPLILGVALSFVFFTAVFVEIDPRKMASGVYRSGVAEIGEESDVELRRDGKTSSVTVIDINDTLRVLATNGKPDASMELDPEKPFARDEVTQILTGTIPLLAHPDAQTAAIIGIGSGMSTHALLASPRLQRVDTIEIEAAMVEGARRFLPAVRRAFDDPRSHILIDDARTYFSARQAAYDVIISEPSNPWVSGVSGLFSEEFYRLVRRHLADGGVFAQWMQLYEIDMTLVSTVFKAIDLVFDEFVVYETDNGNVLILAASAGAIGDHAERVFATPAFPALLSRIEIHSPTDLRLRRIGSKKLLMPLFDSYPLTANSDFYPVLDLGSASRRYLGLSAEQLTGLSRAATPFREIFGRPPLRRDGITLTAEARSKTVQSYSDAESVYRWVVTGDAAAAEMLNDELRRVTAQALRSASVCGSPDDEFRRRNLTALARRVIARLDAQEGQALIDRLTRSPCSDGEWIGFLRALVRRDGRAIVGAAAALRKVLVVPEEGLAPDPDRAFLIQAQMFGHLLENTPAANLSLWEALAESERESLLRDLPIRLMLAHSGWRPAPDR